MYSLHLHICYLSTASFSFTQRSHSRQPNSTPSAPDPYTSKYRYLLLSLAPSLLDRLVRGSHIFICFIRFWWLRIIPVSLRQVKFNTISSPLTPTLQPLFIGSSYLSLNEKLWYSHWQKPDTLVLHSPSPIENHTTASLAAKCKTHLSIFCLSHPKNVVDMI